MRASIGAAAASSDRSTRGGRAIRSTRRSAEEREPQHDKSTREEERRNGRSANSGLAYFISLAHRTPMARGDLELSFVTKITSPKNLLKALAVVVFGFLLPLLGASRCDPDSATRNSISCHTLQIRDPAATPPLTPLALAAQSEPGARARARGVGPPRVPVRGQRAVVRAERRSAPALPHARGALAQLTRRSPAPPPPRLAEVDLRPQPPQLRTPSPVITCRVQLHVSAALALYNPWTEVDRAPGANSAQ